VGFFWIGGVPTAAVKDLAASGQPQLVFVPTSGELQAIDKEFPGLYRPFTLKANAYAGQDQEVSGLGVANVLLVAANAPDELVKSILEGIFGNLDAVKAIHPEARKLSLEGAAAKTAVPLHPAAVAFYQSKGVQL
jgi:TRAP transporter TAXI family solute receptor